MNRALRGTAQGVDHDKSPAMLIWSWRKRFAPAADRAPVVPTEAAGWVGSGSASTTVEEVLVGCNHANCWWIFIHCHAADGGTPEWVTVP